MERPNESELAEIRQLRALLLKQDEIAAALRKELEKKATALNAAEDRIRTLVAASQKNSHSTCPASEHAKRTTEELEKTQASPIAVLKPEPVSPSRRIVPCVSLPPPRKSSTRQTSTNEGGLPFNPNPESSTLDDVEATEPSSISAPPNLKPEPRPPLTRRRLIPYVSVPPSKWNNRPPNKRPADDDSTPSAAKRSKKEPKTENIKVFNLPTSITDAYLKSYKPLNISPPPLSFPIPRKLLRLAYGGKDQQFLQFIKPANNPSGPVLRRMVWPQVNMNPLMPTAPGHPGIVFASRHEILENPPWTLWCRCPETKTATWRYLGEYESELCGLMSAEQFRDQPQKAKDDWASLLITGKTFDVYVAMRARIALRKYGIFPVERVLSKTGQMETDEEMSARAQSLEKYQIAAIKSGGGLEVEPSDIISAFSRGDEAIDIIRMRCVSYDHVFVQDLRAKFNNYDELVAQDELRKADTKAKKERRVGSQRSKSKTRVTKRSEKGKGKARRQTLSEEADAGEQFTDEGSSRPRRKSTKWDAKIGGRVLVGDADVFDRLGRLALESGGELSELTGSDTD